MHQDTIAAIATPPGKGGIGVIRVSGDLAASLMEPLFGRQLRPRTAEYCRFLDEEGNTIDSGIAIFFKGPASFTGEDSLELHAHSNRLLLNSLLARILQLGPRLARPGEFTERAFHNEKLDLTQAEAVADLVNSASDQAARSAVRSLEGHFSRKVELIQESMIAIRMFIESALDFPEEEIDFINNAELLARLDEIISVLAQLTAKAHIGSILNEGANLVIVGKPNVGKSTLLNRLADSEAAIVADKPGTTRDLIERDIILEGVPVHVVDTAGLRITDNPVEQEGVRRAKEAIRNADIMLLVKEDMEISDNDESLLIKLNDKACLIRLINKIDLSGKKPGMLDKSPPTIYLSAKTGEGYEYLLDALRSALGIQDISEDTFMARKRHLDALEKTLKMLKRARSDYSNNKAPELLAEDLRCAHQILGEITGEFASDDLLARIFSEFCIGK